MKKRRKFTPEDRLNILQEARREGRVETIRKYNLAPSLFDRWRSMYELGGIDGLKNQHKRVDPAIRELEEENQRLKRIVANQALELEVKSELLKKTTVLTKKK